MLSVSIPARSSTRSSASQHSASCRQRESGALSPNTLPAAVGRMASATGLQRPRASIHSKSGDSTACSVCNSAAMRRTVVAPSWRPPRPSR
ncbi:hypothetical protein ACFPRL_26495 [Pseudoclavibacter helvolus]